MKLIDRLSLKLTRMTTTQIKDVYRKARETSKRRAAEMKKRESMPLPDDFDFFAEVTKRMRREINPPRTRIGVAVWTGLNFTEKEIDVCSELEKRLGEAECNRRLTKALVATGLWVSEDGEHVERAVGSLTVAHTDLPGLMHKAFEKARAEAVLKSMGKNNDWN